MNIKKLLPYIIAVAAFVIIGYAYAPYTLGGKVVNQSDISSWNGMAHEIVEWNEAHPDDPAYWTNSMFGGMPATTISVKYHGDLTQYLYDLMFVGQRPASYLIICMTGAFLMFLAFGVNIWLAVFGAIAVTFCSYNMQIILVGHNTKMIAIAFMPWVVAALVWAYRKCAFWGALLFGFALSFQIKANHPQISYYLAIIVAGAVIWQLCKAIKEKSTGKFFRTSLCVLVAGLLGIAANVNHLWPTYEYGKHTMRGGSELVDDSGQESGGAKGGTRRGLDLEYATRWSYGIEETPNLFIPNFNGGASAGPLKTGSAVYKTLTEKFNYPPYEAERAVQSLPLYWGPQDFTAGPMYMGAVCIFLFVFGLFVVRGGVKWWLVGVSLLALLLGWGYHFMPLTKFFFYNVPLYSKFRTVSMILVILQITIPLLAVLALDTVLKEEKEAGYDKNRYMKALKWSVALTGGFALLFALVPSLAGSFTGANDSRLPGELAAPLATDRMSLLRTDALRSLLFVVLAAAVLWSRFRGKLKLRYTYIRLILLIIIDLWPVDKRYLSAKDFVSKEEFSTAWRQRPVDKFIADSDKDADYRVLDLSVDPFNNSYTSYWHKTIGGYSPAKMQRYQDLIDHYIYPEIQGIIKDFGNVTTLAEADSALTYHPVLSMLNTRYIITGANNPPVVNRYAFGNCWYADTVIEAEDANDEIRKLGEADPRRCAVVSREFMGKTPEPGNSLKSFTGVPFGLGGFDRPESGAAADTIYLTAYSPNRLVYRYTASCDRIALFSEVYYPGWKAEINGCESEIFRADWILRGLCVPAGEGEITFVFRPDSFVKGPAYSMMASGLLVLILIAGAGYMIYRRTRKNI